MICPRFSYTTSFIRLICFLVCYSLVAPLPAFTIPDVISTSAAAPAEAPIKTKNFPLKAHQTPQKARWRDGELLVHFRAHAPTSKLNALLRANGAQWNGQLRGDSGIERLRLSTGLDPEVVAVALRASELVDFAEPNYFITADQTSTQSTPNDPRYPEQWALKNTVSSKDWSATTGAKQTVIAIIDSGIDFTHPDLNNNQWGNTLERANDRDNDGNGFTSDLHGWDFLTNTGTVIDEEGHGTAIAGIIAAEGNNAAGISGVMWRASLMSLRVLDSTGTGDIAQAVEAIDYAVNNGAQVINCSWGLDDASLALREAINRAAHYGVVVVVSAGNQTRDIEANPHYPASFDLPNLISVGATDNADHLASFSNRGTQHVSIAAPGADVLTTKMGGDYRIISGTSTSTAFVTGVAGLVKTLRPWLGAERTREMVLRGARQVAALSDKVASKGIVSAAGTLETLNALSLNEGLDESIGNNGGEHGNNRNGRSTQGDNRPGAGNGNGNNHSNRHRDGHEFATTPPERTKDASGAGLPNLDKLRRQQPVSPKAAPPVPSTRCSHHNPDCRSVKQRAAIESPADLLALSINPSSMESLDVEHSRSVSDTLFKLRWIPQPLLAARSPLQPQSTRSNVALAAHGSVAIASSTTAESEFPGLTFPPSGVIDGDQQGLNWEHGGGWRDATNTFPDWIEVDFNSHKSIDEIDVFTLQDNYSNPVEPTEALSFSLNGITAFEVQYWNGASWVTVPGGSVTANNKVWRKFIFTSITTSKVRVLVTNALNSRSRLVEVEAWGTPAVPTNVALAANGGVATASSTTPDTEIPGYEFHTAAANDGDRAGLTYPHNAFWRDATANSYPDWLQIAFNGSKSISEIDVFTLQDNIDTVAPSAPTEAMSFTQSGITEFEVQYWNGLAWATVTGGSIAGNNKVWRKFTFSAITTTKIRVLVNNALSSRSRIAEVEAWEGTSGSSPEVSGNNYSTARLEPVNQTGTGGVDLLSGNANWSLPILGLKGRAGLDLGLALSYNSLVWTKDAASNSIKFDADQGSPSPGFRLGFPVIQQPYYNSLVTKYAYLLMTPAGSHVELRQVGTSNVYQSADSSYLQLTDHGGSLTLRPTDGSQLSYSLINGQYQCTQVKDRNGNYITVSYYTDGRINTITDTLSRVITFNYDTNLNLISITQDWGGTTPHAWATFGWGTQTVNPSFTGMTVVGPQNNTTIAVLRQVSFSDGSRYNFEYNSYAQVYLVRHYAFDNHQRSYSLYTLPTSTTDCPRVTNQYEWAENWNNNQEAMTAYSLAADHSFGQETMPDGTSYKELYATSGWQKGLTTGTEFWSGGVKKKSTATAYTQDDTTLLFQKNPRVIETNIYDVELNHQRTTIDYGPGVGPGNGQYAQYGLPYVVREYASDGVTEIRQTYTDYNLSQSYLDQHIIGLVSAVHISNGSEWQTKIGYFYDAGGEQLQATATAATQHDASYGAGFTARGNVTSVARYDVTDINNESKRLVTQVGYDVDGSVIFSRDPLNHQSSISYADSFSDGNHAVSTFAYPTKVTPPIAAGESAESLSSTTQYNYYFGAVTQTQGPALAGQTVGPIQTMQYDAAGRISRVDNASNGAWKYWAYPDRQDAVQTLTTINSTSLSYYQIAVVDGAGRLRAQGGDLPNSTGLYWGQFTYYDVMGRVSQTSNPAEITSVWTPTGEDAAGWVWTQQAYDWKGRPTIKTNPDGTTNEASYGGCGCAGGEVVTTRDEVGRQQKVTSDVLGRVYKTEILNWDGSPYSTIINTYNARDQITSAKHYQGTDASGVYQESTAAYDGYGRLVSSHAPDQRDQNNQSLSTTYTYYADDTRNVVTDARGATTSFSYNNRHQVTGISYTAPAGITVPAAVSFAYDAVGNRTGMTDGLGSISYNYDQLSRLTSETRNFTGVGSFTLQYGYNLSGEVTSVTDQWNAQAIYNYDHTGRLQSVTGAGGGASTYASNMQYRAWGALKHLSYGNNLNLDLTYNNRLQATKYDLVNAGSGARVMGREYQYTTTPTSTDNDGRVKYSRDLVSDNLDRTYTYNHTGNLQSAKAGVYQQNGSYYSGPFEQGYSYDEWDNLTGRSWRTFGHFGNITFAQHPSYSENYVNNRNTTAGWQYDANGNLLTATGDGQTRQYTYDAAGMMLTSSQSGKNITQAFDGDGQKVKFVENGTVTYYVRSSALGGQTLSEVNQSGAKVRGYVYAGGVIIAKQEGSQVLWDQKDVSGVSMRLTNSSGTITSKVETDPLGTQVDDTANYNYSGGSGAFNPMGFYGDPQQPNMGCSSDGVPTPCSMVAMSLRAGAARQCPNNYCGTTAVYDHAANNGRGGYVVGALGTNPNTGALGYWTWQRWHTSASGPDSSDGSIVRIGSSGMRPVFHSLQQGPDPYFGLGPPPPPRWPVSKEDKEFFRGILEEQLKNPKCGGFLNPLFEAVKDKTNRDYSPVLQAFDETTFYWGRPEGWYGGYATWEHGKRIAIISENFKTEKFISKDRTAVLTEMTAGIFFGETLHHVGNPIYTDADYANVINAIRGDNLPAFSDRTKFEVFRASNYFHHNADAACPIPRK